MKDDEPDTFFVMTTSRPTPQLGQIADEDLVRLSIEWRKRHYVVTVSHTASLMHWRLSSADDCDLVKWLHFLLLNKCNVLGGNSGRVEQEALASRSHAFNRGMCVATGDFLQCEGEKCWKALETLVSTKVAGQPSPSAKPSRCATLVGPSVWWFARLWPELTFDRIIQRITNGRADHHLGGRD